ncbi:MAG: Hsp20/alpha crystallin family protein [Minisyncoccota bacterium]
MDQDSKKFFEELAGASSEEPKTIKISDESEEDDKKEEAVEKKAKEKKIKNTDTEEKKDSEVEGIFEEGEGQLTIDVYQTPDEVVVESTIAGVKPEDLDISITNEAVTIRGKREKTETIKDEDYFYQECYWGKFSRSIILPQEIDADKAVASLKNGILIIKLPKLNRQRSKKLKIKFD